MSSSIVSQAGEFIPLAEAAEMTARYRESAGADAVKALLFNKQLIIEMLSMDDCAGMRVYFARGENMALNVVLVGTNAVGDDLIDNPMVNRGLFCPPTCPDNSPLNS